MRPIYNNILETIGNTPMIKLNKVAEDFPCPVYAKVEYFNPGHSVKDRMALQMIEDAEARGDIKPGRYHHRMYFRQHGNGTCVGRHCKRI